jgi:hypothetical protein
MENNNNIYNIDFVSKLTTCDDTFCEKMKIMDAIDKGVSQWVPSRLAHIVPILYSISLLSGFSVFIYKIII